MDIGILPGLKRGSWRGLEQAAPHIRDGVASNKAGLAAQHLGYARGQLVFWEKLLRLRWAGLLALGIAVEHEQGRLHEELGRRFTRVQRDKFELCELLEIKIDVHSINPTFGR